MVKKIKVELRTEIVNRLIKLKNVGDTYSDVIEKLLDLYDSSETEVKNNGKNPQISEHEM